MKVAIPSIGTDMNAQTSPIFGRCPYFVIVDVENGKILSSKAVENTAANQRGGAGITSAEVVGNSGAEIVIAQALGPRAFGVLTQLGIKIYVGIGGSVMDNIEAYQKGELTVVKQATGPMGAGMGQGAGTGAGAGAGTGRGLGRGRRWQQ